MRHDKIHSGHGAELHDLSTTSFRSASAIRLPTDAPPTSQGNPCHCVWLKHLVIRASSMPRKTKKRTKKKTREWNMFAEQDIFWEMGNRKADGWCGGELTERPPPDLQFGTSLSRSERMLESIRSGLLASCQVMLYVSARLNTGACLGVSRLTLVPRWAVMPMTDLTEWLNKFI